jgi:hypothetical protein
MPAFLYGAPPYLSTAHSFRSFRNSIEGLGSPQY